jgi:hypothetical protein
MRIVGVPTGTATFNVFVTPAESVTLVGVVGRKFTSTALNSEEMSGPLTSRGLLLGASGDTRT